MYVCHTCWHLPQWIAANWEIGRTAEQVPNRVYTLGIEHPSPQVTAKRSRVTLTMSFPRHRILLYMFPPGGNCCHSSSFAPLICTIVTDDGYYLYRGLTDQSQRCVQSRSRDNQTSARYII